MEIFRKNWSEMFRKNMVIKAVTQHLQSRLPAPRGKLQWAITSSLIGVRWPAVPSPAGERERERAIFLMLDIGFQVIITGLCNLLVTWQCFKIITVEMGKWWKYCLWRQLGFLWFKAIFTSVRKWMCWCQADEDPPHAYSQLFYLKNVNGAYYIGHDIFRLSIHNAWTLNQLRDCCFVWILLRERKRSTFNAMLSLACFVGPDWLNLNVWTRGYWLCSNNP